jgi:hypothetical protein
MGFTSQYSKTDGFDGADAKLVRSRGAGAVRGFLLKDYPQLQPEHLQRLRGLVAQGKLRSVYDPKVFVGVDSIADAVEFLHSGSNVGKPVVRLCTEAEAAKALEVVAAPDSGPAVGSMDRVREIRDECLADDIDVDERMAAWSEARLTAFFENGGEE